jgi:hypothetical protein
LQRLRAAARATVIKDKLEGIARGEEAIEDGRTVTHSQAKQRMARWLEYSRPSQRIHTEVSAMAKQTTAMHTEVLAMARQTGSPPGRRKALMRDV